MHKHATPHPAMSTAPDRIRAWVLANFNPRHVEAVTADLIDVATGNRPGNSFERGALARIFPEWPTSRA